MVTFDSEELKKLIKDRGTYSKGTTYIFVISLCIGVIAAALTADVDKFYVVIFALLGSLVVGVVATVIFFIKTKGLEKRIGDEVKKTLATAIVCVPDLLSPDLKIAFVATYSGDNLTLSRQNTFKEITFDLSGIKKSPKTYSNFGTYLVEYLQGYFAVHTAKGCQSVTIADNIGGRAEVIEIVACGKPCNKAENNYFIKRGLIK